MSAKTKTTKLAEEMASSIGERQPFTNRLLLMIYNPNQQRHFLYDKSERERAMERGRKAPNIRICISVATIIIIIFIRASSIASATSNK